MAKVARSPKTHCKRGHEFTPENTYVHSDGGRRCRACGFERDRLYRENNREAIRERERLYRENNREAVLESDRLYRENNREAVLERKRLYYENNREAVLERDRLRYDEQMATPEGRWKQRQKEIKHTFKEREQRLERIAQKPPSPKIGSSFISQIVREEMDG